MAEELIKPDEVQLIVIIPGSHLEYIQNPEESTFLGYIPDGLDENGQPKYRTTRTSFADMTPLFGVSQVPGNSIYLVPSLDLFTRYMEARAPQRIMTEAEYDALPEPEKNNGTMYFLVEE